MTGETAAIAIVWAKILLSVESKDLLVFLDWSNDLETQGLARASELDVVVTIVLSQCQLWVKRTTSKLTLTNRAGPIKI